VKGTDGKEYYGILQDVIELHYVGDIRPYKTILFKCDWYDCINGVVAQIHTNWLMSITQRDILSMIYLSLQVKSPKFALCLIL